MPDTLHTPAALAHEFEQAMKEGRLDAAESVLVALTDACGAGDDHDGLLTFRVSLMLCRRQAREAYFHVVRFDSEVARALQAVCLRLLRDPLWEGVARSVRDEGSDPVRHAMDQLLAAA
jgi:hypothetical protein